jgi:predicted HTH domain antitoxin
VAHQLNIEYGDDVLASAAMPKEEFDAEAKLLLAAKLYDLGKLSSGQAAGLCGKGRVDFLLSLPRVGVSITNLRPEDSEAELEFLRNG